ncbi:MAG: HEAT repeat domain-containing protein, partial [Armatimonadetes bacterium]|nr:HEAT repeat domain-containing protein [Anaerolineae bacterium]
MAKDNDLLDLDDADLDGDDDPFGDVASSGPAARSLEDFEAEVDAKIRLLLAGKSDAKQRTEAAYWLGESGAPKAITALRRVYEKDTKNKGVQQAAAYALGQFKALDAAITRDEDESVGDALGRDDNQDVVALLTNIALYDARGKRRRTPTSRLLLFALLLTLTLGGFIVANLTLPARRVPRVENSAAMRGTGTAAQSALGELGLRADELRGDAQALQTQLTAASTTPLTVAQCATKFTLPGAFSVNEQVTDSTVLDAAERYNALHTDWVQPFKTFDDACFN